MSSLEKALLTIEVGFWTEGPEHYREHADDRCLVAFPGMARTLGKEELADTVREGPRWSTPEVRVKGLVTPTPEVAILTYEATAERAGVPYAALVSSGYVRRGGSWKLGFHAQAPLPAAAAGDRRDG